MRQITRTLVAGRTTGCYPSLAVRGPIGRLAAVGPLTWRWSRRPGPIGPAAVTWVTEPRLVSAGRTGTRQAIIVAARTDPSGVVFRPSPPDSPLLPHVRFGIVGAGRLGASLAIALRAAGAELAGFVCATSAGAARAQSLLHADPSPDLAHLVAKAPSHYFITVPDGALPTVAETLGGLLARGLASGRSSDAPPRRPFVFHTSGATSARVLLDAARAGAACAVFHPLQTFSEPLTGSTRFVGAAIAVTPTPGEESDAASAEGFALAQALRARPFLLPDDRRTLYHAAASVAANYLVTLEHCAQQLFVAAGMPEDEALALFLPLVGAALENVGAQGPVRALTGPLCRGDLPTISAHLEAVAQQAPGYLALYRLLGLYTLDLVRARGDVASESIDELVRLLSD